MNGPLDVFDPAFDMPSNREEALAVLREWANPLVATFHHARAAQIYGLLTAPASTQYVQPTQTGDIISFYSWLGYDRERDQLVINDKRYSAALFGPEGFLAPAGTLLRIIDNACETITVQKVPPYFNFLLHLYRQQSFSERTFGPGERSVGLVDHIRKELIEIEAKPADLNEWIDVVILGLDGAWRCGVTDANPSGIPPEQIIDALVAKQTKNEGRQWPDWRTAEPGKAIEHVRAVDESLDIREREAL